MGNLITLRDSIEQLFTRETIFEVFLESVKAFEQYLLDFNKLRLSEGEDIRGNIVGRYSRATELEALFGSGPRPIQPKREGEPYNFEWTGGLFGGMRLVFGDREAIFDSTDSKTRDLVSKYGEILGIQQEDLTEAIRDRLLPDFLRRVKLRLGL
jgi:hypothetical protein